MTWTIVGISLFAANISSSTLVGLAGDAYKTNVHVFNYEWLAVVVLIVFAIFFMPFYIKSQVYTMPEFLERWYDSRSRYYFLFITLIGNVIVDTAAGLYVGMLVNQALRDSRVAGLIRNSQLATRSPTFQTISRHQTVKRNRLIAFRQIHIHGFVQTFNATARQTSEVKMIVIVMMIHLTIFTQCKIFFAIIGDNFMDNAIFQKATQNAINRCPIYLFSKLFLNHFVTQSGVGIIENGQNF
jgi:hypothetical protein